MGLPSLLFHEYDRGGVSAGAGVEELPDFRILCCRYNRFTDLESLLHDDIVILDRPSGFQSSVGAFDLLGGRQFIRLETWGDLDMYRVPPKIHFEFDWGRALLGCES